MREALSTVNFSILQSLFFAIRTFLLSFCPSPNALIMKPMSAVQDSVRCLIQANRAKISLECMIVSLPIIQNLFLGLYLIGRNWLICLCYVLHRCDRADSRSIIISRRVFFEALDAASANLIEVACTFRTILSMMYSQQQLPKILTKRKASIMAPMLIAIIMKISFVPKVDPLVVEPT